MAVNGESGEALIRQDENVHVELTYEHLDIVSMMDKVKSPKAGAIVTFNCISETHRDGIP